MRFSIRPDRFAAIAMLAVCLAVVLSVASQRSRAQDAPAAEAEAAEAAELKDPFAIPEGDADAIQKFMHQVAQREPEGETEQEQRDYSVKLLNTLVEAGDRLLKAKPSERQAAEAHQFKIMALGILVQLEQEEAAKKLPKAIDAARNDEREQVAVVGWQSFIQNALMSWETADDSAKQAFLDDIMSKVNAEGGPQAMSASIVWAVASNLDGVDDEFAKKLLAAANPVFESSDDEAVKQVLVENNLQGILRRLNLMGQPMEITGTLLDGKELDWNSYRGKVVLVDFWAGWCGPCRREIPNILKLYEAYHDKGFDVLGISLDLAKKDTERAMREDGIPWQSIFQEPKEGEGDPRFSNPMVKFYGITGIPKAILVDKDGKVVHMEARGETLAKELQRLLGDPLVPLDEEPENDEADLDAAVEK